MEIPDSITVKLIDDKGKPVANVLVFVNYVLEGHNSVTLKKVTESNGELIVKKSDFIQQLDQSRKLFLMDYKGNEKHFKGEIIIEIESISLLNNRVDRIKTFYPDIAKDLEGSISNVKNGSYSPIKKTIVLSGADSVTTIVCHTKMT